MRTRGPHRSGLSHAAFPKPVVLLNDALKAQLGGAKVVARGHHRGAGVRPVSVRALRRRVIALAAASCIFHSVQLRRGRAPPQPRIPVIPAEF